MTGAKGEKGMMVVSCGDGSDGCLLRGLCHLHGVLYWQVSYECFHPRSVLPFDDGYLGQKPPRGQVNVLLPWVLAAEWVGVTACAGAAPEAWTEKWTPGEEEDWETVSGPERWWSSESPRLCPEYQVQAFELHLCRLRCLPYRPGCILCLIIVPSCILILLNAG